MYDAVKASKTVQLIHSADLQILVLKSGISFLTCLILSSNQWFMNTSKAEEILSRDAIYITKPHRWASLILQLNTPSPMLTLRKYQHLTDDVRWGFNKKITRVTRRKKT